MANNGVIADPTPQSGNRRINSSQAPFQALAVLLQHPAITSHVGIVCSLLQVCKSSKEVLLQSKAANISVDAYCRCRPDWLCWVTHFAAWLPQQAGLVGEIIFNTPWVGDERAYHQAAEQLIAFGCQQAAAKGTLRLHSFSTDCVQSPSILRALPAFTLTSLRLSQKTGVDRSCTSFPLHSHAVMHALAQLTNLRVLKLHAPEDEPFPAACLTVFAQLSLLSNLEVQKVEQDSDLQALPRQLQELCLGCAGNMAIALGHMSMLRELDLVLDGQPEPGSVLPASITALRVEQQQECSAEYLAITSLHNLQQLTLTDAVTQSEELRALSTMQKLLRLELIYESGYNVIETAPAWAHLSQLQSLTVNGSIYFFPDHDRVLYACLSAATTLTYLRLSGHAIYGQSSSNEICAHLKSLKQLQSLVIDRVAVPSALDMLQLTALTNLTSVTIDTVQAADDTVVAALAVCLKQLQKLRVVDCGLRTAAVFPALATATGLTNLCIAFECKDPEILPIGYSSMLTALSNLKKFQCDMFEVTDVSEVWDSANGRWHMRQ